MVGPIGGRRMKAALLLSITVSLIFLLGCTHTSPPRSSSPAALPAPATQQFNLQQWVDEIDVAYGPPFQVQIFGFPGIGIKRVHYRGSGVVYIVSYSGNELVSVGTNETE